MKSDKSEEQTESSLFSGLIDLIGYRPNAIILPEKYFVKQYNTLFNSYSYSVPLGKASVENVIKSLFLKFNLTNSAYVFKTEIERKGDDSIDFIGSSYLIEIKKGILLFIDDADYKFIYDVKINFSLIQEILTVIKNIENKEIPIGKFSMLATLASGKFYLKSFELNHQEVDLEINYNTDFSKTHKIISNFLNTKKETGLVLLHGKYGTGKTHYLRYLISNSKERFIFFPNDLIAAISSPNFLPFISEYKNSVIILEDSDELLKPRQATDSKNEGIVNLLNMSDGLLGDALSIKVICTFNANLKNIDQAILRKGRLIARYQFQELCTEKAQKLSKNLGFNTIISTPMTLSDIYNQDKDNFAENSTNNKIGFKTL